MKRISFFILLTIFSYVAVYALVQCVDGGYLEYLQKAERSGVSQVASPVNEVVAEIKPQNLNETIDENHVEETVVEYIEREKEATINAAKSEVEKLRNSGDYVSALSLLDALKEEYGEVDGLSELYRQCNSDYADIVMNNIDAVYKEQGLSGVQHYLYEADRVLNGNMMVHGEYLIWSSRQARISLLDHDYEDKDQAIWVNDDTVCVDNFGKRYARSINQAYHTWTQPVTGSVVYDLTYKEYRRLRGVICVDESGADIRPDYHMWGQAAIEFYGDGNLLGRYTGFSPTSEPINVELDITGIELLEIRFIAAYWTDDGLGHQLVNFANPAVGW